MKVELDRAYLPSLLTQRPSLSLGGTKRLPRGILWQRQQLDQRSVKRLVPRH